MDRRWLAMMVILVGRAALGADEVRNGAATQGATGASETRAGSELATTASGPATTAAAGTVAAVPAYGFTGDWGGWRGKAADAGWTFGGFLQFDTSKNLRGGRDTEGVAPRYLLDLNATLDTAKAFAWPGGTAYAEFQSHDGPNGSDKLTGDTQGFDNMDGPHYVGFEQLWYQQAMGESGATVKAGKIDANNDFFVMEHGKEFLNATFGYSAAIYPMPTYPDPGEGAEVFFAPNPHVYAGFGALYANRSNSFLTFVGHPEKIEHSAGGMFFIGEAGARWNLAKDALAGHGGVGVWGHTGRFPDYPDDTATATSEQRAGTGGTYALLDQTLWEEHDKAGHTVRSIGGFANYAWSDPATNPVTQQVGDGLTATGFIPSRAADLVGVATSWAQLGHTPGIVQGNETVMELFYKLNVFQGASLKPDLQYIVHPGGMSGDALVVTLRVEVDF